MLRMESDGWVVTELRYGIWTCSARIAGRTATVHCTGVAHVEGGLGVVIVIRQDRVPRMRVGCGYPVLTPEKLDGHLELTVCSPMDHAPVVDSTGGVCSQRSRTRLAIRNVQINAW